MRWLTRLRPHRTGTATRNPWAAQAPAKYCVLGKPPPPVPVAPVHHPLHTLRMISESIETQACRHDGVNGMGAPNTGTGASSDLDLHVSSKDLTKLADDLGSMREHLENQVKRMDAVVDRIEAGWRGPAATAYREFHRAATEDAVRIREVMKHLEQAVLLGRDGFSAGDLHVLEQMRRVEVDIDSEVGRLSTPNTETAAAPARSQSSLDGF